MPDTTDNHVDEAIDSPVRAGDPQTDVAVTVVAKKGATRKSVIPIAHNNIAGPTSTAASTVHSKANNNLDSCEQEQFNIKLCLASLVEMSEGWSCREIKKLMQNILSRVLSTER